MKTTINGILIVLCIGIFVNLTSCKKDKSNPPKSVDQLSIEDQKIENLIHAFKTKLSSNLKSGDSISVDSVIWYLKMTANSTYGNATAVYDKIATDSSLFTLTIHNGNIPLLDVGSAYNQMIDTIRNYYYSLGNVEKQLLCVAVALDSMTSNTMYLKATSTIIYGAGTLFFGFSEPDDYWTYGRAFANQGGYCGGQYQGTNLDKDAATEIARRIMLRKGVPIGNYYYDPQITKTIRGTSYPIDPSAPASNYHYYYMYCNNPNLPGLTLCLSPQDCNFYLTGTEHVIYTSDLEGGARPPSYSFIAITLQGDFSLGYGRYMHYGTALYGVFHQGSDPSDNL